MGFARPRLTEGQELSRLGGLTAQVSVRAHRLQVIAVAGDGKAILLTCPARSQARRRSGPARLKQPIRPDRNACFNPKQPIRPDRNACFILKKPIRWARSACFSLKKPIRPDRSACFNPKQPIHPDRNACFILKKPIRWARSAVFNRQRVIRWGRQRGRQPSRRLDPSPQRIQRPGRSRVFGAQRPRPCQRRTRSSFCVSARAIRWCSHKTETAFP